MKPSVFLSYRRDGGEAFAQMIYERFRKQYRVFYDIQSRDIGDYRERIKQEIDRCDFVIVVLSQHSLDRCIEDENDMVRYEIEYAKKMQKKIITVLCRGFVFPKHLPKEIDYIRYANGVAIHNMEHIDEKLKDIHTFISSESIQKKRANRKAAVVGITIAVLVLSVLGALYLLSVLDLSSVRRTLFLIGTVSLCISLFSLVVWVISSILRSRK